MSEAPVANEVEANFTDSGIAPEVNKEVKKPKQIVLDTKADIVEYLTKEYGEDHRALFKHTVDHLELLIVAMGGVFLGVGAIGYAERDKIKAELKKVF